MQPSKIIDDLIRREGGYISHPLDRGGPTKYGITLGTLRAYRPGSPTVDDVKNLTEEEARNIYLHRYVFGPGYQHINNERLRALLIDSAVQHGAGDATKFLQRALLLLLKPDDYRFVRLSDKGFVDNVDDRVGFKIDGICGPLTIQATNNFGSEADDIELYSAVVANRAIHYGKLISDTPSQAVFAYGWMLRLAEFIRIT